jgi:hypothetical protein
MIDQYDIIYLVVCINCCLIGYLLGKNANYAANNGVSKSVRTQQIKDTKTNQPVSIDETKVVMSINTDNLTKKYDELGDKVISDENISSSINKLKNMKG